jgi:hypothetical protein
MSPNESHDTGYSTAAPAIVLWVLVICGLTYGVVETATKVPALFGG